METPQLHADRVEHGVDDGDPLIHVAADQELHGGAMLKVEDI